MVEKWSDGEWCPTTFYPVHSGLESQLFIAEESLRLLAARFQSLDTGLSVGPVKIRTRIDDGLKELSYVPIATVRKYFGLAHPTFYNQVTDPVFRKNYSIDALRDPLNGRLYISSKSIRQLRDQGFPKRR